MLKGWIAAELSDQTILESLGVIVGEYDNEQGQFNDCIVSEQAFKKLDLYWGRYYWKLNVN